MSKRRFRPRLVPNAGTVAKHSWSFRLSVFGAVAAAVELGMSVLTSSPPISPVAFAGIYAGVSGAGAIARLVAQVAISGEQA